MFISVAQQENRQNVQEIGVWLNYELVVSIT